ncbi:hypothetical protein [Stenotrophomonas maltophilia]|jgi:multisubunit Na+/H+ antiporter MnhG subunit|uniref:hypothetical protein n=1 Tax=Stenotrophomonas maltophilia TaxID=40324 RepID=UPI00066B5EFC|nr:hypothetical protein [Stenotrophomonas maltophilia]
MHAVFTDNQLRRRRVIIPAISCTAIAAIGIVGVIILPDLEQRRDLAAFATAVSFVGCVIALVFVTLIARINYAFASDHDVQQVVEMLETGVPGIEPIAKAMQQGTRLAYRDVEFATRMELAWKRSREEKAHSINTNALISKGNSAASRYLNQRDEGN